MWIVVGIHLRNNELQFRAVVVKSNIYSDSALVHRIPFQRGSLHDPAPFFAASAPASQVRDVVIGEDKNHLIRINGVPRVRVRVRNCSSAMVRPDTGNQLKRRPDPTVDAESAWATS